MPYSTHTHVSMTIIFFSVWKNVTLTLLKYDVRSSSCPCFTASASPRLRLRIITRYILGHGRVYIRRWRFRQLSLAVHRLLVTKINSIVWCLLNDWTIRLPALQYYHFNDNEGRLEETKRKLTMRPLGWLNIKNCSSLIRRYLRCRDPLLRSIREIGFTRQSVTSLLGKYQSEQSRIEVEYILQR